MGGIEDWGVLEWVSVCIAVSIIAYQAAKIRWYRRGIDFGRASGYQSGYHNGRCEGFDTAMQWYMEYDRKRKEADAPPA